MALAKPVRTRAQRDAGMSISQAKAANGIGSSTNTGGSSSGMDIITDPVTKNSYSREAGGVYSPYTAPAGTPPPVTPAKVYGTGYAIDPNDVQTESIYNKQLAQNQRDSASAPNERSIYRDKLNLYQKEIDATNQIYTQKLAEARQQGLSNLGSGRAIQARSGTLGSDFAVSQNAQIEGQNTGVYNAVLAEQQAKIGQLMGTVRKDAADEVAAKRLAYQEGQKEVIANLAGKTERQAGYAKKVAAFYLDQGTAFEDIDPANLAEIAKTYQMSTSKLKEAYDSEKKTRAEKAAKEALEGQFSLSPEEMRFDATGKLLAQGGPKTYAPQDSLGKIVKIGGVDYIQNSDGSFSLPSVPGGDTSGVATSQLTTARNAITEAKKLAQASGRGRSWIEGINQGLFGATDYTNLEAYANTIRTSILTLATDPQIKKFFGPQMSNTDVQLMVSAGTALNPELMSPAQFNDEIVKLETLLNKLEAAAQQSGGAGGMTPEERQQLIDEGFDPDDGSVSFNGVGGDTNLASLKQSLVAQESGGNYSAVGIPTVHGRALGKYQIIPKFHFDKIGLNPNLEADQRRFLNSPQLQDQVFALLVDDLATQYNGDPRKIAAAYYGGDGGASVVGTRAGDKPQAGGMPSINEYVRSVVSRT